MASPMQFCMETSDWLKAIIPDEGAADVAANSSSPPSGELTPCPLLRPSGPMLDRRLRPPHDQALKCPRCDSGHTKFCYYNNYSLSQPRYFCKACRRYWTKGGSLRNVPIGGGCRKNKRPAASSKNKPPTAADQIQSIINRHHQHHQQQQADLGRLSGLNFMFDSVPGCSHFAAGLDLGLAGDHNVGSAPLGYSIDEACQRLAMPFGEADVKPGNRMLSLEWPEQGCGDAFGYSSGSPLGLWAGMINGHGP